jgi:hypothetical protein
VHNFHWIGDVVYLKNQRKWAKYEEKTLTIEEKHYNLADSFP